jgi:hypothetical protein
MQAATDPAVLAVFDSDSSTLHDQAAGLVSSPMNGLLALTAYQPAASWDLVGIRDLLRRYRSDEVSQLLLSVRCVLVYSDNVVITVLSSSTASLCGNGKHRVGVVVVG